jgi:hypothetical protein
MAIFTLSNLRFIDFHGTFCREGGRVPGHGALPGECFYFLQSTSSQISIRSHLVLILPATLLACMQFLPLIRHKAMLLHRCSGYITLFLGLFGAIGVVPSIRHAFGGDIAAQAAAGTMTALFVGALLKAYVSIRRRQVDQHEAWMIRAWVYVSFSSRVLAMLLNIILLTCLSFFFFFFFFFLTNHTYNKPLVR